VFDFIDQMSDEDKEKLTEIVMCNIEADTIQHLLDRFKALADEREAI
jgi:nitrogen-specific signal transduction histidine kinase